MNRIKREERDRRSALAFQSEQKILQYCSFPQTAGILSTQSTAPTAMSVDLSAPKMFEERKKHVFSATQSARNALVGQKITEKEYEEKFFDKNPENETNVEESSQNIEIKANCSKKDSQVVRFCLDGENKLNKKSRKNKKNKENENKYSFDLTQLSLDVTELDAENDDVIICRVDRNKVSEVCK